MTTLAGSAQGYKDGKGKEANFRHTSGDKHSADHVMFSCSKRITACKERAFSDNKLIFVNELVVISITCSQEWPSIKKKKSYMWQIV